MNSCSGRSLKYVNKQQHNTHETTYCRRNPACYADFDDKIRDCFYQVP